MVRMMPHELTDSFHFGTGVGNPKAVRALRFALKYVPPTIILEYEVVPSKSRRHLTLTIAKLTPKKDPCAAQPLPCPGGIALLGSAFCHPQSAMLSLFDACISR